MAMELRHLRYFVAVVEEGSLTTAASLRLRTSQPSLSRQIRDLEYQVGAELLSRSVHCCGFRRSQPSIPIETSHLFRLKPARHSDGSQPRAAVWSEDGNIRARSQLSRQVWWFSRRAVYAMIRL